MSDKLDVTIGISADASGVEAGVQRSKRSLASLGDSAKRVSQDVGGMGDGSDKSAKKIERDTRTMQQSLQRYIATLKAGSKESRVYWEQMADFKGVDKNALRPLLNQLDELKRKQQDAAGAAGGLGRALSGLAGAAGTVYALKEVAQQAYETQAALFKASAAAERLKIGLDFASSRGSVAEIAYLRKTTYDLGLQFQSTAQSYMQFQAAVKGTSLEGEKARTVFESVAKATAVMGLSAEQNSGVLLALQQMVSKGTVQAEELRGQLSERLPGAFQIAARSMGVTTAELGKMLEMGQVISEDFLPKFAAELERSLGDAPEKAAERLDAAANRVTNSWERLKQNVGDSGVSKFWAGQLNILSDAMGNFNQRIESARDAGEGFGGQMLSAAAAALEFVNPINAISYSALEAGNKLKDAENRLQELKDAGAKTSSNLMLREAYNHADRLVQKLRQAKAEQDALVGSDALRDREAGNSRGSRANYEKQQEAARQRLLDTSFRDNGAHKQFTADLGAYEEALRVGVITTENYIKAVSELSKKYYESTEAGKAAAKAARDAAKGNNAGENSILSYIKSLEARTDAQRLEIAQGEKLTESQRARIQLEGILGNAKTKASKSQVAYAQGLLAEAEANEAWLKNASDVEKALADMQKAREQSLRSVQDSVRKLVEEAETTAYAEAQNISLAEAVERLALARAENAYQQAVERQEAPATLEYLRQEIEARKELVTATAQKGVKEANKKAAEQAAKDWEKVSQTIGDTLADYIMGGGKDAAQYLERLFSTLVLQPMVQTVVGGAMGGLGLGGPTNGGAGSSLNALSAGKGLWDAWSGSTGGMLASGVSALGSLTGSVFLGELGSAVAAGVELGISGAAALTSSASATTTAGMWLGAAAPWVAGIGALLSIVPSMLNGGTPHAGAASMYSGGVLSGTGSAYTSRVSVTDTYDAAIQKPVDALAVSIGSALDGLAKQFSKPTGYSVGTGFKSDNDDPSAGRFIVKGPQGETLRRWEAHQGGEVGARATGERYDSDPAKGFDQYLQSVTAATIPIVQGIVPGWADSLLDQLSTSLGIAGAIAAGDKNPWKQMSVSGQEAFEALQTTLAQIAQIDAAFDALGKTMVVFADMTDDMQTALLGGLGGMEGFSAAAQAYYAGFYSEQERYTEALARMQEALAGIGVDIDPAMGSEAKAQYRALVESAFADGDELLATQLLALSGAFAQTADAAQKVTDATQEQAQALTQGAIDLLSRLPGGAADARDMQSAALAQQASAIWGGTDVAALQSTILSVNAQELEAYLREAWAAADTVGAKQAVVDFGLAMVDFVGDAQSAEEAIVGLSDVMRDLLTERKQLEAEMLRASGDETGYAQALRAIATEGYTEAEIAAWDYNESLRAQISALDAAAQAQEQAASNQLAIARQVVDGQRQLAMDAAAAVREQISDVKNRLKEIEAESDWVRDQAGMGYGQPGVGAADKFTASLFSGYEGYAANMGALAKQYDGMAQAQKDMLAELESEESRHKGTVQRLDAILNEGKSQVAQLMSLETAIGVLQGAVVGAIGDSVAATVQQPSPPVATKPVGDPVKDSYQGVIDLLQSQRDNAIAALAGDAAAADDFFAAMHAAGIGMFDDVANHSIEAFDKEIKRLQDVVAGMRTIVPATATGDTPRVVYEDGWRGNQVDQFAFIEMLSKATNTEWGEAVYGDAIREYGEKFADRIAQFLPAYDPAFTRTYERITGKPTGGADSGAPSDTEQTATTPELTIADYKQLAQLQQQYWQLLGDEESIRKATLAAMHPQLQAMQERIWLLEEEKRVAEERSGLERQLLQLQGDTAALRQLELDALDPSNHALQERIWMLEEEKRVAEERNGLMTSLYQALGNTAALRAQDLESLDPSNRGLQQQVWQIEDAKSALEKALQAESESANAAQQAAQERVSTLQSIFDALKSNVDSLYDSVEATQAWGAAQANTFIDNALANARATGYMPELDDLSDAIAGARAGLDKEYYATEFDKQRDTLVLAGKLSELQDISGGQLTTAEQQLKAAQAQVDALDGLQKQGQEMLDSLSGNASATLSVRDAISELSAAVLSAQAAYAAASSAAAAAATAAAAAKSAAMQPYSVSDTPAQRQGKVEAQTGVSVSPSDSALVAAAKVLYQSINGGASTAEYNAAAAAVGGNIAQAVGWDGSRDGAEELRKMYSFAVGTNYVPRDMVARIHEGEAIVPKAFNPFAGGKGMGTDTARLEALVEGLTAEVKRLQSIVARGVEHQRETAEILDNVTEGGNAMRSEGVA